MSNDQCFICCEVLSEFFSRLAVERLDQKLNLLVGPVQIDSIAVESLLCLMSEFLAKQVQLQTIEAVLHENLQKHNNRLVYLFALAACTMVNEREVIAVAVDLGGRVLAGLHTSSGARDVLIVALCLLAIYEHTNEHELLQDAFILAHYANILDPQAEVLMVRIGEKIAETYCHYPSLFESRFVEFVTRRVISCRTGRTNNSLTHIFTSLFLHNHLAGSRLYLIKNPDKFTEYLKKGHGSVDVERLYMFKISKDASHWYNAVNSVYNGDTKLHARACRLANIYHVAESMGISDVLDMNERLVLLSNSIHDFLESDRSTKINTAHHWELANGFNVDAFTNTSYSLYNFLLHNKAKIVGELPFDFNVLDIHQAFPVLLIKQITLVMYDVACMLSGEVEHGCLDNVVYNIDKFLDIISPERKFDSEFEYIHQFVVEKSYNTYQKKGSQRHPTLNIK